MQRLILSAVLVALSIAFARPADACRCVPPKLPEAVKRATFVFAGKLAGVTKRKLEPGDCGKPQPNGCIDAYSYQVEVEHVWKGEVPSLVTIDAGTGSGDCSLGELRGDRWLFVTGPSLWPRICSGTQQATPEIVAQVSKALGAPRTPAAQAPAAPAAPAKPAKP